MTKSVVEEIWQGFRLQPVPESTLKDQARGLHQKIKLFVDNCLDTGVRPSEYLLNNDALVQHACLDADWIFLLTDKRTRYAALRMFIARVLIARIDVRRGDPSLIASPALRDTYQLISPQQDRGREYCRSPLN